MATVFFKINNTQESEIKKMMKEEGYDSKAEFFRFLVKFYKYNKTPEQREFEISAEELSTVLRKLNKAGKFNESLDKQLEDV